LIDLFIAMAIY